MEVPWPGIAFAISVLALVVSYLTHREIQALQELREFRQFLEKSYRVAEKLFEELGRFFDHEVPDKNIVAPLVEKLTELAVVSLRWAKAKKQRAKLVAEFGSLVKLAKRLEYSSYQVLDDLHPHGGHIFGLSNSEQERQDRKCHEAVELISETRKAANKYGILAREALLNL